ncbi:MAG: virulence RhuM family protein [bacterium]|nr:virulence RhuM family protein [bacterium]
MSGELLPAGPGGEFLLYQTEDGRTRLEVRFKDETVWLSLNQMAELFQRDKSVISRHIRNVFEEGELRPESTVAKSATVQTEGQKQVTRDIEFYNLDVIISVGYRVKSHRGTQFRIWATQRLREYIVKGFTMDDERLKNPPCKGHVDYFDELLERIRDIRASERRMYLRVRDILALATDYDPKDEQVQTVFQTMQNKLHFAVTGKTAPELIAARADAAQLNMGLTAWKTGIVRKGDVVVAKNYLREGEITELNRIVVMFLDFAEDQARRRKQVFLRDWQTKLDEFLRFNERKILPDTGKISREQAEFKAHEHYAQFEERRRHTAEDAGQAEALKALEQAAHQIEQRKTIPRKRKKGTKA